jgi:hypothetical protein
VNLDDVWLLAVVVVKKNDVRGENRFTMTLEVADFLGHKFMDGAGEGDVSRSDVNLHDLYIATADAFIPAKIRALVDLVGLHFDEFQNLCVAQIRFCVRLRGVDHVVRDAERLGEFVGDHPRSLSGLQLR